MRFLGIEEKQRLESIIFDIKERCRREDTYFTLEEIAFVLGCSPERVRQIEKDAITKLKKLGTRIEDYI